MVAGLCYRRLTWRPMRRGRAVLLHWPSFNCHWYCLMMNVRKLHRYLGVFFAPAILFFAVTGALQTFGLHEAAHKGDPPPVAWIAAMASIHKDQELREPHAGHHAAADQDHDHDHAEPAPPADAVASVPASAPAAQAAPHAEKKSALPLKLFVLALAVTLCISTLLGLTLALNNPRTRKSTVLMLVLGVVVPLLLLLV